MTRPLYASQDEPARTLGTDGHAGLWFDKFCDRWDARGGWTLRASETSQPKLEWIRSVCARPAGQKTLIDEYILRSLRLVDIRSGRFGVFRTTSRFVTGMGRPHPVENGFVWHSTLGTPTLPGSSVKGMLRAWALHSQVNPADITRLLGCRDQVGSIIAFDAVPTQPVSLEVDVLTPHYAHWEPDDPPGDWRSPHPVSFLVTKEQTPFLFAFLPRRGCAPPDLEVVWGWLNDALEWNGAGAKTAVGYGRFTADDRATNVLKARLETERVQAAELKRQSQLSPLDRELETIKPAPGTARYIEWLNHLKKDRWSGETAREVADRIKREMENVDAWRPVKRGNKPDKDHQRTLDVMRYLDPP